MGVSFGSCLGAEAKDCDYRGFLEEALRDKFVCGLVNEDIKKELLKEKELTLNKACKIAISMEAAANNTTLITLIGQGQRTQAGEMHRIKDSKPKRKTPPTAGKFKQWKSVLTVEE